MAFSLLLLVRYLDGLGSNPEPTIVRKKAQIMGLGLSCEILRRFGG